MIGFLDEYFPEYQGVFKDLSGKASWYILNHLPFPKDIRAKSIEQLTELLKQASRNRVGEKRARKLKEAAQESIGVEEGLEAAGVRLKSILRELQFYKEELEKIHQQMEKALQRTQLKDIILSIPGIGVVTAASFLGEVGDVRRFDSWKQIRKLAGYNLVESSSGERKSRSKISKRGRSNLRSILYQASILVSKNQEFKALYKHLKTRPNNPLKSKQASSYNQQTFKSFIYSNNPGERI